MDRTKVREVDTYLDGIDTLSNNDAQVVLHETNSLGHYRAGCHIIVKPSIKDVMDGIAEFKLVNRKDGLFIYIFLGNADEAIELLRHHLDIMTIPRGE